MLQLDDVSLRYVIEIPQCSYLCNISMEAWWYRRSKGRKLILHISQLVLRMDSCLGLMFGCFDELLCLRCQIYDILPELRGLMNSIVLVLFGSALFRSDSLKLFLELKDSFVQTTVLYLKRRLIFILLEIVARRLLLVFIQLYVEIDSLGLTGIKFLCHFGQLAL